MPIKRYKAEQIAPGDTPIPGQPIAEFLPSLQTVMQQPRPTVFRTELRCHGKRDRFYRYGNSKETS